MDIDRHSADLESRRASLEKEVGVVTGALEAVIARFREGLARRRAIRVERAAALEKVDHRRRETVECLRELVMRIDAGKRELRQLGGDLERTSREEVVLAGRYQELLAGRFPVAGDPSPGAEGGTDELVRRKEAFLERIEAAFAAVEADLARVRERKGEAARRIEELTGEVRKGERSRTLLFGKLDIYKHEQGVFAAEARQAADDEGAILEDFTEFVARLGAVTDIPPSVAVRIDPSREP